MNKLEYTLFYAIGVSCITLHIWIYFGIKDPIIKFNFDERNGSAGVRKG